MPKPFITYDQQIELLKSKHDLFAVVIAFRYLLPTDAFSAFKQELSKEIDRFSKKCASLSQGDLLSAMGFPSNWKNISRRYKL